MKKLIHIVSSLNVGGAEKFVKNLSIEQNNNKQMVEIVSFGKKNDVFQHSLLQSGINIINLEEGLFSRLNQLVHIFRSVDIIHIHSPAVIRAILPIFPILLFKKVIYTIHGEVDPPQSLVKFSHQISLLYLNKVVAVSQSAKESVEGRYGWKSSKVDVIKNGVNVVSNLRVSEGNNKIILGIVSRLIPLKNIPLLFDAINLLPLSLSRHINIHIFGDGPCFEEINKKSQKLPAAVDVKFFGNMVDESDIYTNIDVLVMCSNTEGLPMSILEAMGYGIPVISTDVGAISQVVIDLKTGWLYPKNNVNALVDILHKVICKPELILVYGKQAKEFIDQHYVISKISEDYKRLYEA